MKGSIGPDGLVHEPGASPAPPPRFTPRPKCDYRESCGCQLPRCLHPSKGPEFGTPEAQYRVDGSVLVIHRVSQTDCVTCGGVFLSTGDAYNG